MGLSGGLASNGGVSVSVGELPPSVANASSAVIAVAPPTGTASTDTANVAAALAAAKAAGGGRVLLAAGTYSINATLVLPTNTQLSGAGAGVTVLQLAAATNADLLITDGFYTYTGTTVTGSTGPSQFSITELTLDGNYAGQTAGVNNCWPLRIYGRDYYIANVHIDNGVSGGAWSEWKSTADPHTFESRWTNVRISDYQGRSDPHDTYGLYFDGPHDSKMSNIIVSSLAANHSWNGTTYGFYAGANALSVMVTNMHVWGRHNYSLYMKSNTCFFANCYIEGADTANVVMSVASSFIGGWIFGTNGTGTGKSGAAQTTEQGLWFGDSGGSVLCNSAQVVGTFINNFADPGRCVNFANENGGNVLKALTNSATATLYTGTPNASDTIEFYPENSPTGGLFQTQGKGTGASSQIFNPATTLSGAGTPLSVGGAITSLPVAALTMALPVNTTVLVSSGTHSQTWTLSAAAAAGATSLTVYSQTPSFAFPSGSNVGPLAQTLVSTLSGLLSTGGPITSLPIAASLVGLASGTITVQSGLNSQTWTLNGALAATDTSITVTSQTPSFAFPAGSPVIFTPAQPTATWTKPNSATVVQVMAIGAGGGGQAGGLQATNVASIGGNGGGGGGFTSVTIPASVLPGSVSPLIGAGGLGGAADTIASTTGADGGNGGNTTFATYAQAVGGTGGVPTSAGAGGLGETQSGPSSTVASSTGLAATNVTSAGMTSAGGAGGGIKSDNSVSAGAKGGAGQGGEMGAGAAGATNGGTGGNGTSTTTNLASGGGGGGGGGSHLSAGGNGGNGGNYGAGGGGGGASQNTGTSGQGAHGSNGIMIVSTW